MKNKVTIFRKTTLILVGIITLSFIVSCSDLFEFELPESNSKVDTVLPTAAFSYIPDAANFKTIKFTDLSIESTEYFWDFGGGATSTLRDPSYTFEDGEGNYPVTLTASDDNGASNSITINVEVVDKFVPLTPTILNGDFEANSANWSVNTFTGGTTSPFESSSDGSWLKYDGTDNGSKTRGAKWNKLRSAGAYLSSNTRYAYQALSLSPSPYINPKFPNRPPIVVKYILEYEYAIKTESEQSGIAPGGNRIIAEILNGHFNDGVDAVASSNAGPIARHIGTEVKGKTVFTKVELEFTSAASGEVAIWIYGVTDVDSYVDNVKVYPVNN